MTETRRTAGLRSQATTITQAVAPEPRNVDHPVGATITVLSGSEAGRILFVPPAGGLLGREVHTEFCFADGSISREHARLHMEGDRFVLTDLQSLNGTFVDGERVQGSRVLPPTCRIQLAHHVILQLTLVDQLEAQAVDKLSRTMLTDPLTGTGNRAHLQQRLKQELNFAHRHGTSVGLLLLDLDHFTEVNDTHGHPAGDALLGGVGETLLTAVRAEDAVFRYGGEEFCILVRGLDLDGLVSLAERIRERVAALVVRVDGTALRITTSVGVAHQIGGGGGEDSLLLRADRALYRAKNQGRNRVVIAD